MQARRLTAREGMLWLFTGLRLYLANPPLLIGLTFSYLFVLVVVSLIPYVGIIAANLGLPALVVMVANGCRAIDQEHSKPLPFPVLLQGLTEQRPALLRLGGVRLAGAVIVQLISSGISSLLGAPETFDLNTGNPSDLLLILLPPFVVGLPLLLAFWFAPLLVAWQGVPPAKSMFFSLAACWRNWRAFAAFTLTSIGLGMIAPSLLLSLPAMVFPAAATVFSFLLGMVMMAVLAPILMTSVYVGYRDIFSVADE